MNVFEYELPPELIAERPIEGERDRARFLVCRESLEDRIVHELPELLPPDTLMLLNDTKVLSCRFFPEVPTRSEVFLVKPLEGQRYSALVKPKKKFKLGLRFKLSPSISAVVVEDAGQEIHLELSTDSKEDLQVLIEREGRTPIPPYIRGGVSDLEDAVRYQTVFAANPGSVAAPTASLHFTESLLERLKSKGVIVKFLTLHVGLHSILPADRQSGGVGEEQFVIPPDTFAAIKDWREKKRPILGVGTTVTRAVESLTIEELLGAYDFVPRTTSLFISPGCEFKVLTHLMTNFHLSGSTHLSLVAAFYGEERLRLAYQHAVKKQYRFYSYGDSMLLERAKI